MISYPIVPTTPSKPPERSVTADPAKQDAPHAEPVTPDSVEPHWEPAIAAATD